MALAPLVLYICMMNSHRLSPGASLSRMEMVETHQVGPSVWWGVVKVALSRLKHDTISFTMTLHEGERDR